MSLPANDIFNARHSISFVRVAVKIYPQVSSLRAKAEESPRMSFFADRATKHDHVKGFSIRMHVRRTESVLETRCRARRNSRSLFASRLIKLRPACKFHRSFLCSPPRTTLFLPGEGSGQFSRPIAANCDFFFRPPLFRRLSRETRR